MNDTDHEDEDDIYDSNPADDYDDGFDTGAGAAMAHFQANPTSDQRRPAWPAGHVPDPWEIGYDQGWRAGVGLSEMEAEYWRPEEETKAQPRERKCVACGGDAHEVEPSLLN